MFRGGWVDSLIDQAAGWPLGVRILAWVLVVIGSGLTLFPAVWKKSAGNIGEARAREGE